MYLVSVFDMVNFNWGRGIFSNIEYYLGSPPPPQKKNYPPCTIGKFWDNKKGVKTIIALTISVLKAFLGV